MSTTELFVELIVIGMGAIIWIYLLVISIFGFAHANIDQLSSLTTLIPFLSITYVLGIVIDRLADVIFERIWSRKIFCRYYREKDEYYEDRRTLYLKESRLVDLLEYGRSRIRICRGWALNSALILLTLNLFIWTQLPGLSLKIRAFFWGSLLCTLLMCGTWFAWYKLTSNDYRKVKEQSAFLRQFDKS